MVTDNLLLLRGNEIKNLLTEQEPAIIAAIQRAYQAHASHQTTMPPDSYLRFPGKEKERIISKAAYLGGDFEVAGIKWIASFPSNIEHGLERASATLILNATDTGRPFAVMESSIISAQRTAASAAVAAQQLSPQQHVYSIGLIGGGPINYETLRFLLFLYPMIERVYLYDVHPDRAHLFSRKVKQQHPGLQCEIATSIAVVLQTSPIIAIATSAIHPHIASLAGHHEAALLLHTSLRDIAPHLILQADNVVDDIERVCSNQTSVHLAMQQVGNHDFIRTTIGDILNGNAPKRNATRPFTIYSAFGLGILDLAVAQIVYRLASEHHMGTTINSFEPGPWQER